MRAAQRIQKTIPRMRDERRESFLVEHICKTRGLGDFDRQSQFERRGNVSGGWEILPPTNRENFRMRGGVNCTWSPRWRGWNMRALRRV